MATYLRYADSSDVFAVRRRSNARTPKPGDNASNPFDENPYKTTAQLQYDIYKYSYAA